MARNGASSTDHVATLQVIVFSSRIFSKSWLDREISLGILPKNSINSMLRDTMEKRGNFARKFSQGGNRRKTDTRRKELLKKQGCHPSCPKEDLKPPVIHVISGGVASGGRHS